MLLNQRNYTALDLCIPGESAEVLWSPALSSGLSCMWILALWSPDRLSCCWSPQRLFWLFLSPYQQLPPHISAGKLWLLLWVMLMSSVMAAALNCVLILQRLWLRLIFVSLMLLHFRNAINKIFLKERKRGRDLKWKTSTVWTHLPQVPEEEKEQTA